MVFRLKSRTMQDEDIDETHKRIAGENTKPNVSENTSDNAENLASCCFIFNLEPAYETGTDEAHKKITSTVCLIYVFDL